MASEITNPQFDVIVIGAGINGAGIARDAAMRGLKVLLLDKGDIGGGTSSWSTRLIHGGLRYLELAVFEIAQAAMNQSCRPARSAAADVALIEKQDLEPAHRRVARDTGAVYSSTDHDHVKLWFGNFACHLGSGHMRKTISIVLT